MFFLREEDLKTWADGVIADCRSSEEDLVLVGGSSFGAFSAQVQLQVITERDSRTLLHIRLFIRCPPPQVLSCPSDRSNIILSLGRRAL